MERFIWKTSLRFESFPIAIASGATDGQITWAFVNSLIDYDEDKAKVHEKCLDDWNAVFCPVCHEKVITVDGMTSEEVQQRYRDQIYRPGDDIPLEIEDTPEARERRREIAELLESSREPVIKIDGVEKEAVHESNT